MKYFTVIVGGLLLFLSSGCRKEERSTETPDNRKATAINFLLEKKLQSADSTAFLIYDALLDELQSAAYRQIAIEETKLLIFDLKGNYPVAGERKFQHIYRKAAFHLDADNVQALFIYEINTDLSEHFVDANLSDIILQRSKDFVGSITTFSHGGRKLFASESENGKLQSVGQLEAGNQPIDFRAVEGESDCIYYYWVTTYYFADGSVRENWQFMYSSCSSGGGGASGGTVNRELEKSVTVSTTESDPNPDGQFEIIRYSHNAKKFLDAETQYVRMVEIFNTTAQPMISPFVDKYGFSGTRRLTLLNHYNYFTRLTPPMVLIYWTCNVYFLYAYPDASRTYGRQYNHLASKVS